MAWLENCLAATLTCLADSQVILRLTSQSGHSIHHTYLHWYAPVIKLGRARIFPQRGYFHSICIRVWRSICFCFDTTISWKERDILEEWEERGGRAANSISHIKKITFFWKLCYAWTANEVRCNEFTNPLFPAQGFDLTSFINWHFPGSSILVISWYYSFSAHWLLIVTSAKISLPFECLWLNGLVLTRN